MPVRHGVDGRWSCAAFSTVFVAVCSLTLIPLAAAQGPPGSVVRRPLGKDLPVFEPPASPTDTREVAAQNPTGPLSLREAVALALVQNPSLAGFSWELRALEA